jgi:hypothetical protein
VTKETEMTDSQRAREPELLDRARETTFGDEFPDHEFREEGDTGAGIIRSGGTAEDRGAIASRMPAADFDERASEAQNDEKESDTEPVDGDDVAFTPRTG